MSRCRKLPSMMNTQSISGRIKSQWYVVLRTNFPGFKVLGMHSSFGGYFKTLRDVDYTVIGALATQHRLPFLSIL
jgi:hypothetical protein